MYVDGAIVGCFVMSIAFIRMATSVIAAVVRKKITGDASFVVRRRFGSVLVVGVPSAAINAFERIGARIKETSVVSDEYSPGSLNYRIRLQALVLAPLLKISQLS